ncbi:RNA-directed DNA polymerase [Flavobacterium sp.]|uniref:RNA-directed DNA polymerase n=1 Tax=Flavobacterium sp. TaxID=239 RepID=UPI004033E9B1
MESITESEVFEKLMDYGFFPEKISSIFTSQNFGTWARQVGINIYKNAEFSNITFHLTRNNNAPRVLHIPHPIAYCRLCNEIKKNWNFIYEKIGEVDDYPKRSLIIPKPNNLNNRLISMLTYDRSKDEKFLIIDKSYKAKYIVHADIANCYTSIYSHSISWALVGKSVAKNNTDRKEWYNTLDFAIRSVQRNETVGIPIGPDTSAIICEIILSEVDKQLNDFNYFRYIDDYRCYCKSKEDAENFIKKLSKELEKFNLRLNQKKTEIISLPQPLEESWVRELKSFANTFLNKIEFTNADINILSEFIDLAIKLSNDNPSSSSIKYAVKILSLKIYKDVDVYAFIIMYISRVCFIYPYFIDVYYSIFQLNPIPTKLKPLIEVEINSILKEHLEFSRSDIALWGIFLAIEYNFKIDNFEYYSNYLLEDRDCLPVLLCYSYSKKKSLDTKKYFKLISDLIEEKLEDEWWIYIYTLYSEFPTKKVFQNILYKDFYLLMKNERIMFLKHEYREYTDKAFEDLIF